MVRCAKLQFWEINKKRNLLLKNSEKKAHSFKDLNAKSIRKSKNVISSKHSACSHTCTTSGCRKTKRLS